MDATAALDRLREISSQVRSAVIFDRGGNVVASTLGDDERAEAVAREAEELLAQAERRRPSEADAGGDLAQLEIALPRGSVFVVRHGDRLIAATTSAEPTVGLVFYDLKTCLRDLDEPAPERKTTTKRKPTRKKADAQP